MPRARKGAARRQAKNRWFKAAKGKRGSRSTQWRKVKEAVIRAGVYATRDRKRVKREYRSLWITRLNAALKQRGVSYSRFIPALALAGIELNRKSLSELAIADPKLEAARQQTTHTAERPITDPIFVSDRIGPAWTMNTTNRGQLQVQNIDRTNYIVDGEKVSESTHYGYDLASLAGSPVTASNAGRVVFAEELGIYGQCVIIDHGLGLFSLYGHLSSIEVAVGDQVAKGQTVGLSGQTGLAGGDHLHFAMLLAGHYVDPVEWWDGKWQRDRVEPKLAAARQ